MEVIELKCPNCGHDLSNVTRSKQKKTSCTNCDALIVLDKNDELYNLEGTKEKFISRGDYFNEHHMFNEALNEYRKAYLLDKTNEHVNFEMDRLCLVGEVNVKKRRDYKKIGDVMEGETIKCPNCGSSLIVEDTKQKVMHCEYCGASVLVKGESDSNQEILEKALDYYENENYDEVLVELEELLVKDKENKYYPFLMNLASSLNKNYWNDIPVIEDKLKDSFKDYYKSLNNREDKSNAYKMISQYVSRLGDMFEDDEDSYVFNTINDFLVDISSVLEKEELEVNKSNRKDLIEVLKRDD